MAEKSLIVEISTTHELEKAHPEIRALMSRVGEIEPKALAEAFYHLESTKEFPHLFVKNHSLRAEETQIYFSRGLKNEIESIYLELAKHLESKTQGSLDLMNAIFDLFTDTLASLVKIPYLASPN